MKILGIDHIGIAPKNAKESVQFFDSILRLPSGGQETVEEQKTMTTIFHSSCQTEQTSSRLEILETMPNQEGPIDAFINKKGGGIHHLALRVECLDSAIQELIEKGIKMIDHTPRTGVHQTRIAFIHPHSTGGILVELVEAASS